MEARLDQAREAELDAAIKMLQSGAVNLDECIARVRRCLTVKSLVRRHEAYKWLVALYRYIDISLSVVIMSLSSLSYETRTLTFVSDCSTKRDYDAALWACEDQLRNAKDIDDNRETELSVMGKHLV